MKPDQERVKNLLTDTVTLLCKNGLFFNDELRIEGLLGVTIDSKDAFFVHISEQFGSGAEHNDGNIIANVLSSKDSSKFLSERRKSHRTDDSPQRSRDSARSTPTRPLSQQSSHSPGIREPRSEKRKSLDTPPGVRVKKERYDDDLMLIDSKRRVPLPHGPLSQDDAEAMRQSYGIDANSLGQIQQVQVAHQLGEVKRQSASHLVDAGGGTFVTSMVRQESGATNSPTGNPWPDLAAQVSGGVTQPCDSQMTLDSLPGSSQWSPAQSASQLAATTQPPSASDMNEALVRATDTVYPSSYVTSPSIRVSLINHVVSPLLHLSAHVHAYHVMWEPGEPWMNVVQYREHCDGLLKDIFGIKFFMSSLTSAFEKGKGKNIKVTHPSVAYWIVTDNFFNGHFLRESLGAACPGARIQPITTKPPLHSHPGLCGSLYIVLKDHDNNYIHSKIKSSTDIINELRATDKEPMIHTLAARIILKDKTIYADIVKCALAHLLTAGLHIELIDVESD